MCDYEVIICGAGVGGLALATALGRQGRRVLLLEKRRADALVHRGELLQPRTLEILEEWGVLATLQQRGALPIEAMVARTASGEFLGELNYGLLSERFRHGLVHYYHETKQALASAIQQVEVRYGVQVQGVIRDGQGMVNGVRMVCEGRQETVSGALVVAADGRNSLLRNQVGIAVRQFTYPHQLMGFDLVNVAGLEPKMTAFLARRGVRVLYPMPGERARLYVQIKSGEYAALKNEQPSHWYRQLLQETPGLECVRAYLPHDVAGAQIQGAWNYCATLWSRDGLALLGDAAHGVHPTAGQGMNAAIIDGWSLARAIAEATQGETLTGNAVGQALILYEGRRQEFLFVSRLCHKMASLCTATSWQRRALTAWSLRASRHNLRLQSIVLRNVAGYSAHRFTAREMLSQYGLLPDREASVLQVEA